MYRRELVNYGKEDEGLDVQGRGGLSLNESIALTKE